ncbi:MAG: type VII toxin-antitoxin system HepT family RNase toxin [Candidatus Heimdallarchaeaceae archaeon]
MRNDIILAKIEQIEENLKVISNYLPTELKDFLNLGIIKDGIYKRLEYSIELVLDILAIINTDLKLGIPNEDLDILENIEKNKILPSSLMDIVRNMKSFRNILVHKYGRINDEIVFEILNEKLNDFEVITNAILEFLKKNLQNSE